MKIYPLLAAAALCTPTLFAATPQELIDTQVPQARAILDAWKKGATADANRTLHIVYWTPSDRAPAPQYRERLTRCMTHIQTYYAAEMKRIGFGAQTINLEFADDKLLRIHLVRAPQPYAHYKPSDGGKIRNECLPVLKAAGIDANKETIVIFCNMSNWDPVKKRITQNSPYYAGGNHRQGTAWQVDSPLLDPVSLDKKQPMVHDGQYGHISLGKYNSIFVGGVAHELGHALGLPHNCERADERAALGIALMGSGNRTYGRELRGEGKGSFLTLASSLRLASHPMFTGSVKGMHEASRANLTDIKLTAGDKSITVTGKVEITSGSAPVHAILAYTDPDGGSNYDATTATAIPDAQGRFTLHCTDLRRNGPAKLRLIALHANGDATSHIGSHTPFSYPYTVGKNGQADLSTYQVTSLFEPAIAAFRKRDAALAESLLKKIQASKHPQASPIATRILTNKHPHPEPAALAETIKAVPLADTTPAAAKVGYLPPTYNRLPSPGLLLLSASNIFQHGIYAHAPALHRYQLGGKWNRLSGKCGLADGASGLVVFVIRADGKEIWRSNAIRPGQLHNYNLDVSGKQNIELIVEDGGNGNGNDWGLWLEPTLKR